MVRLVSLQQASDHLRRDTTDDDNDLLIKIEAASQAVLNYITDHSFLNSADEVDYDSADEPLGVPKPLQAATLIIIGLLYADRDGENYRSAQRSGESARLGEIILPRTVHFLLDPYRIPIVT